MAKESKKDDNSEFRLDVPVADASPEEMAAIEQCLDVAMSRGLSPINPQTGKIAPGKLREEFEKAPLSLAVQFTRSVRGLTQRELAEACEVDERHVNMIEREEGAEMKHTPLKKFEPWIGKWDLILTNSWFMKSLDTKTKGKASFEWLDGLLIFRFGSGKTPGATSVIGYSDAKKKYEMLYYDGRGVYRIFDMN
jgi:transcriptional regulator with XRE-family HTH domain